jgi:hypothetical protein
MSNQYAEMKNELKGEVDIHDQPANTYGFIDEFLEGTRYLSFVENKILIFTHGIENIVFIQV